MEHWKITTVFVLLLAMPISSWASITMVSHCQTIDTTSYAIHSLVNDAQHSHLHHQVVPAINNSNVACECSCSSMLNCAVSGGSTTVLLEDSELIPKTLPQLIGQSIEIVAPSPDPHTHYRPPILLS